jgi:hypothetical protein
VIEPSPTRCCPVFPAAWARARKAEVPTLRDLAVAHGLSRPAPAPAGRFPLRKAEVMLPCACGAHPGSSRGLLLGSFTFHARGVPYLPLPGSLIAPARRLPGPYAENGELESQRLRAHSLSKRSRHPGRFILQGGERRTRIPRRDGRALVSSEARLPGRFALQDQYSFRPPVTASTRSS